MLQAREIKDEILKARENEDEMVQARENKDDKVKSNKKIKRKKIIRFGMLELPVNVASREMGENEDIDEMQGDKDAVDKRRKLKRGEMAPISQRHSRVRNLQGMPTLRSKSTKKLDQYLLY